MSGIIPPSIVTYSYKVDRNFDNYVNVSFPFRVKLNQIWFTGDVKLHQDSDQFGTGRGLKLAAIKSKNPKNPVDAYDYPSDWNNLFGTQTGGDGAGYWENAEDDLKPTMWIGNPDDRPAGEAVQYAGFGWWGAGFRSTSAMAPSIGDSSNGYWINWNWSEEEYNARKYKTDLSIMEPNDMLTMMVYSYTGDWNWYEGDAMVTIHIAYTGIGTPTRKDAVVAEWTDWWYD